MDVAIVLMTGRPELAERSDRAAVGRIFGNERAVLGLRNQNRRSGVLQRADAVQNHVVERDVNPPLAWQDEPCDAESDRREHLNALRLLRHVRHDEGAVRRERKAGGIDDVAFFRPQLNDLPDALPRLVDSVDAVASAVENEELTESRLLEAAGVAKAAGDVRWNGVLRTQDLGPESDESNRREYRCAGEEKSFQYLTVSRMALRTSADWGRTASSRSGQYGTGESRAPTRFTGASRYSNSSPTIRAAISAPNPHVI